jgi:hypothetical protein
MVRGENAMPIRSNARYAPSEDIVAREIEGEMIIVPISAGIGDAEDELYSLNETGRAIWKRLDGRRTVEEICTDLRSEFAAPAADIEMDVKGLLAELLKRRMVIEKE